jgi:hypothetical protein
MEAEFFRWWVADERTGVQRLTAYKLSRVNAERAFPGAEPDPATREVRVTQGGCYSPPSSRPGMPWA